MLTRMRISLFVMLLAGLAACTPTAPAPVPAAAIEKGITEPLFIQPERMAEKAAIVKSGMRIDVVFIGDSITQNYEKPEYKPIWDKYFAPLHALNLGYGMDTTGAVHWRIEQGELKGLNPRVTVLLIGTNDSNFGRSTCAMQAGIDQVVDDIKRELPRTKILFIEILPSDRGGEKFIKDTLMNFTSRSNYEHDPRVTVVDLFGVFTKDKNLNPDFYVEQPPDGALHPNPEGQARMAAAIAPIVKRMLSEAP